MGENSQCKDPPLPVLTLPLLLTSIKKRSGQVGTEGSIKSCSEQRAPDRQRSAPLLLYVSDASQFLSSTALLSVPEISWRHAV